MQNAAIHADPLASNPPQGWKVVTETGALDAMTTVFRSIKTLERHAAWRKTELSPDDEITRAMDVVIRFAREHQVVPA